MRRKSDIGLILLLIAFSLYKPTSSRAQEITMWIMPNEPPAEDVSDTAIARFMDRYSTILLHTQEQLREDHDFAACVLGQRRFLEIISGYIGSHPPVRIRVEIIPWIDALDEILYASLVGEGHCSPDIVQLGTSWTPYFAYRRVLVDLTEMINPDDYYAVSIASCKIGESKAIWAVPWFADVRVLYYWRDILDSLGISAEHLMNWESFRSTCEIIRDNTNIKPFGIPMKRNWDLLHELAIWIWASEGDILREGRPALNKNEALTGIEHLHSLRENRCLDLPEIDLSEIEERFVNREYAMIIGRGGVAGQLNNMEEIGFSLPPGRITFVGGSNLAILKSSQSRGNFNEALNLVRYLSGISDMHPLISYTQVIGMPPARTAAVSSHFGGNDTLKQAFEEVLSHGWSYPNIPEWAEVVEKSTTLNSIWLIWHDIKIRRPITKITPKLEAMAAEMETDLFMWKLKRLILSPWRVISFIAKTIKSILFGLPLIFNILIYIGGVVAGAKAVYWVVSRLSGLIRRFGPSKGNLSEE